MSKTLSMRVEGPNDELAAAVLIEGGRERERGNERYFSHFYSLSSSTTRQVEAEQTPGLK